MSFNTKRKKIAAAMLAVLMIVSLCSCGKKNEPVDSSEHPISLSLYASNNSVLAVSSLVDSYKSMSQYAAIKVTYDEPEMLAEKIQAGYDCDIFICESDICMDWLDKSKIGVIGEKNTDLNPNKNDRIDSESRAEVFKGTPEGSSEELVFSAAMVKSTEDEKEVLKFLDFIKGEQADKAYESSGFTRIQ